MALAYYRIPIGSAIRPRMTSLIAQGKEVEMLALYRKSSQFVAIIAFTVKRGSCNFL